MAGCLVRAALLAQVKSDPAAALRLLEKAEALSPGRPEVLRSMIDVLAQLRRRDEAVAKARLLAELYPDSPEARLIAGRYGIDLEDIERRGAPVLKEKGEENEPEREAAPEKDKDQIKSRAPARPKLRGRKEKEKEENQNEEELP
jgi:hypothetical protein